jgi:hypothetical protein
VHYLQVVSVLLVNTVQDYQREDVTLVSILAELMFVAKMPDLFQLTTHFQLSFN